MEGPRTVPFTADPSVVLCTEHAGTVAPFYFLNLRYGSKYGTFENRIICGANKNFLRAGFEPATSVLPYIYIYIYIHIANFYCWYLLNSLNQTDGSYSIEFQISRKFYRLITNIEKVQPFLSRAAGPACVHTHMVL